ncbi:rhodanese-like domain-containing protein [Pacificoceanicola onchidii]|uniref:rhodanese-like domain-containing protein n=1 Tax=Pacificoceanicola onchidii TaxID=2562685 RepID=UPI0010A3786B|nr:rhodanese-like domain-containing protein [Pacificoceanicola onchidii]
MIKGLCLSASAAIFMATPLVAQSTRISEDRDSFSFTMNGTSITIDRNGPACPPACLQPMQAAAGVSTVGELEILDFLDLFVSGGQGLLIDTRLPEAYNAQTIPGAVNVPAETLRPGNQYRDDLLNALGVRNGDFSAAYDLVLFSGSSASPAAAEAVRDLLGAGYPATKLKYYRGGLGAWVAAGLRTAGGQ